MVIYYRFLALLHGLRMWKAKKGMDEFHPAFKRDLRILQACNRHRGEKEWEKFRADYDRMVERARTYMHEKTL
jgi:hypothetical protein